MGRREEEEEGGLEVVGGWTVEDGIELSEGCVCVCVRAWCVCVCVRGVCVWREKFYAVACTIILY